MCPARFIPACAGNTLTGRLRGPVHPRLCGEHAYMYETASTGSSPPVRGTRHGQGRRSSPPNTAGNAASHAGSSPPVRGTRLRPRSSPPVGEQSAGHRFIPACAGNTLLRCGLRFIPACAGRFGQSTMPQTPVHPRLCGEHKNATSRFILRLYAQRFIPACAGNTRQTDHFMPRFIPACAGNTHGYRVLRSVHPRLCGEHRSQPSAPPL